MKQDVIIIGGGAAGLMCAVEAGKRGRKVLLIEHARKVGKKILISGGGRCNFTNFLAGPQNYRSQNEHFCKSALARYPASKFISLVEKHGIRYHEKKLGQLFCDESARQIVKMLLDECSAVGVEIRTQCTVMDVRKGDVYQVQTTQGEFQASSVVVATGGLSIPKMGASDFGHRLAKQFGLKVTETSPALVPFTFSSDLLLQLRELSGISIDAEVSIGNESFRESILITHKGVSGPAILQISSYWKPGDEVIINLLPNLSLDDYLEEHKDSGKEVKNLISELLPKRFVERVFSAWLQSRPVRSLNPREKEQIVKFFHTWKILPAGTEGYRTAEVTLGGVDTAEVSSKTFEARKADGLYFIGEVLDVTGWLGGYNFQWAWASGYCAGQYA